MKRVKVILGKKYIDWFSKEVVEIKEKLMDDYFRVEGNGWQRNTSIIFLKEMCGCSACQQGHIHSSDCAVHNEPMRENGECDCSPSHINDAIRILKNN